MEAMQELTSTILKLVLDDSVDDTDGEKFLTIWLFIGSILCFLAGALCSGVGIGGGAFYLPVFVIILRLNPHEAIPLSKVTTFGVSIGSYIITARKRHPTLNRPLIYYDIAMLMEPTVLIGTIAGVYLNIVTPTLIIFISLLLLLSFSSYETTKKAYQIYKNEQKEHATKTVKVAEVHLLAQEEDTDDFAHPAIEIDEFSSNSDPLEDEKEEDLSPDHDEFRADVLSPSNSINDSADVNTESLEQNEKIRNEILLSESKTPFLKLFILFMVWVGMLILILFKGGSDPNSSIIGIQCGSLAYWLIVLSEVPYLLIFAGLVGIYLRYMDRKKESVGYSFEKGDVKWTLWNTTWLPLASIVAGFAAGFLGIGGGMINGPIIMSIDALPQVATATSAFMIMFTASSTTIQFIILGKLPINYAIWYFFVGLFAAVVGQLLLAALIKKYQKQSYVGYLLAICIILSTVALGGMTLLQMFLGQDKGIQPICISDSY